MRIICWYCGWEGGYPQRQGARCEKCLRPLDAQGQESRALPTPVVDGPTVALKPGRPEPPPSPFSNKSARAAMPRAIDGYEIVSLLGQGGMGSVYLAYQPLLDRKVALKVLHRSQEDQTREAQAVRFLSEVILTGRLAHAGIIPIYQVGHDSQHGYYYTMRHVKGRSLDEILAGLDARQPEFVEAYTQTRLLSLFLRVCEAMAFAHRNRILHRDLKPSNLMVAEFGEIFVLDWGLAKDLTAPESSPVAAAEFSDPQHARKHSTSTRLFLLKDKVLPAGASALQALRQQPVHGGTPRSPHLTQCGQVLGTPGYLSPEQGRQQADLTPASDVYSLGVILYRMLTGQLPIDSTNVMDLVARTIEGKIVPIQERPAALKLPRVLCELVMRALAPSPQQRYADAGELAADLALFLEGRSPWRKLASDACDQEMLSTVWKTPSQPVQSTRRGLELETGAGLDCACASPGDLRVSLNVTSEGNGKPWMLGLGLSGLSAHEDAAPRCLLRVGQEDRPVVELLWEGRRVQRRLDARLQSGQSYRLQVELEQDYVRAWLDGKRLLEYRMPFPQIGGSVSIQALHGPLRIRDFELQSRGAPMNLPFTVLPDHLFGQRKYAEARELYRQLADSHSDREEGLNARYKAGLCSTALTDTQAAFNEFTALEGTMYDHGCALGLAQIGMLDGNVDWAWEALKNAYRMRRSPQVQTELWFALLGLIEVLGPDRVDEKCRRYREILDELHPDAQEMGQITYEFLELLERDKGLGEAREQTFRLLQTYQDDSMLVEEALARLCRVGIDSSSIPSAQQLCDELGQHKHPNAIQTRLILLRAELEFAHGRFRESEISLHTAGTLAGAYSSEGLHARSWSILAQYAQGDSRRMLTSVYETLAGLRHTRPSTSAYLRCLEGLGCLAKGETEEARGAFGKAAEFEGIWGFTARVVLEPAAYADPGEFLFRHGAARAAEASFLAGESALLMGQKERGARLLDACLRPDRERAMFTRLAQSRVTTSGL